MKYLYKNICRQLHCEKKKRENKNVHQDNISPILVSVLPEGIRLYYTHCSRERISDD